MQKMHHANKTKKKIPRRVHFTVLIIIIVNDLKDMFSSSRKTSSKNFFVCSSLYNAIYTRHVKIVFCTLLLDMQSHNMLGMSFNGLQFLRSVCVREIFCDLTVFLNPQKLFLLFDVLCFLLFVDNKRINILDLFLLNVVTPQNTNYFQFCYFLHTQLLP